MSGSTWDSIKGMVASAAPLIGGAIGGPFGGAAGKIIASALGTSEDPDEISKALQNDPDALVKIKQAEMEHQRELRQMTLQAETERFSQQHQTIRAELDSDNFYKSGWRPTIGWVLALSLAAIMASLATAIFRNPASAADVMTAASGVLMFMAGLLGYNAKKRSDDKMVKAGLQPKGIGEALQGLFGKRS